MGARIPAVGVQRDTTGGGWLPRWCVVVPWFAALALAVLWFPLVGTTDVVDRLMWMNDIADRGVRDAFRTSYAQYPPLSFVLLAAPTGFARAFALDPLVAYKASLAVALALTGVVCAWWTRRGLAAGLLTLALTPGTMALGYNDVYYLPPLLLALWAGERRRFGMFIALLAAAALVKWQPLALAPPLLLYIAFALRGENAGRLPQSGRFARAMLPGALICAAVLLVFGMETVHALLRAGADPYLSGNAPNANWLLGLLLRAWQPDVYAANPLPYQQYVVVTDRSLLLLPKAVCAAAYGWVLFRFWHGGRTYGDALFAALLGYLAYWLFNTGVHENHLIPAVVFAAALWAREGRLWWLFAALALLLNLNLWLFYGFDGGNHVPPAAVTAPLALVVVAAGVALLTYESRSRPAFASPLHPVPHET